MWYADSLSANQYIIPIVAYLIGYATKTVEFHVQAKVHFRFLPQALILLFPMVHMNMNIILWQFLNIGFKYIMYFI